MKKMIDKATSNTEMMTISRAEYEAIQAQLDAKSQELEAKTAELAEQKQMLEDKTAELAEQKQELEDKAAELAQALLQNRWLTERLKLNRRKLFGSSSEQMDQLVMEQFAHLFNEAEAWDTEGGSAAAQSRKPSPPSKQKAILNTQTKIFLKK